MIYLSSPRRKTTFKIKLDPCTLREFLCSTDSLAVHDVTQDITLRVPDKSFEFFFNWFYNVETREKSEQMEIPW